MDRLFISFISLLDPTPSRVFYCILTYFISLLMPVFFILFGIIKIFSPILITLSFTTVFVLLSYCFDLILPVKHFVTSVYTALKNIIISIIMTNSEGNVVLTLICCPHPYCTCLLLVVIVSNWP